MYSQIKRFETILYNWTGQSFSENRKLKLGETLNELLKKFGTFSSFEEFLSYLESSPSKEVKTSVIESILIGETYFFRDTQLWESLAEEIIPAVIKSNIYSKNIKIWSAACSTGEEIYSTSILLKESPAVPENWHINLIGTDISEQALSKAKIGIYTNRSVNRVSTAQKDRWFIQKDYGWQLSQEIKDSAEFIQQNLCSLNFPNDKFCGMDIIFCRNVLIYIGREKSAQIISRLAQCLKPNGWLILTPTEIPFELPPNLKLQHMKSKLIVLRPDSDASFTESIFKAFSPINRRLKNKEITADFSFNNQSSQLFFKIKSSDQSLSEKFKFSDIHIPKSLNTQKTDAYKDESADKQDAYKSGNSSQAEKAVAYAKKQADKGLWNEALITVSKNLDSYPSHLESWLMLSVIQEEMGSLEEAQESILKAMYINPDCAAVYLRAASLMARSKNFNYKRYLDTFFAMTKNLKDSDQLAHSGDITVKEARELAKILSLNLR